VYLANQTEAEQKEFVAQTLSLLSRSPVWRHEQPELLGPLLAGLAHKAETADTVSVWLEGPVYNYSSFARVNTALLQAWQSAEQLELTLIQTAVQVIPKPYPDLALPLPYRPPDVLITHHFPHREQMPLNITRIAIMPWEFGIPPKHSARIVRDDIDETWVPSQFSRECYIRTGADPERIYVIPNGVDTTRYCPEGPVLPLNTHKRFRFCYVGASIPRKGFDILLKTYLQTFGPQDDVCLVIKDFGAKEQYAGNTLLEQVLKLSQDPSQAEILYLETDFMPEEDLISLFRACDVYVHPYRGEGFGMGILEAMACGLPVIIPDQGPAPEFCPPAASWQIPCLTRFLHQTHYFNLGALERYTELPSFKLEPDAYFLAQALRAAQTNPELRQQKGRAARQAALAYDWKKIAQQAEKRVLEVARKQPRRSEPRAVKTTRPAVHGDLPLLWVQTQHEPALKNCPIYVDFDFFHPFLQPQTQNKPYGILSVLEVPQQERKSLQVLLQAYERLQVGSAQVGLIILTPEAHLPFLSEWVQDFCQLQGLHFPASHRLVFQRLPEAPDLLRQAYQQASLFVNIDPQSAGHWHLLAQAMGLRCISGGGRFWLERPYCETSSGDVLHLSWLLSRLLSSSQTLFDALAVREHLKPRYDRQQIAGSDMQ
jgi:glycosyltransferase involved in cell wall biosynthesis